MGKDNDFKFFEDKTIDYKNMTDKEQKELYFRMKREKYFENQNAKEKVDDAIGGVLFIIAFLIVVGTIIAMFQ